MPYKYVERPPLDNSLHGLPHLLVTSRTADEEFRRGGQGNVKIRPVERRLHGTKLKHELYSAFSEFDHQLETMVDTRLAEIKALGSVITIEGAGAAYPLKIDSLQQKTGHRKTPKLPMWLLLSAHPATDDEPERAIVWVSDKYRTKFLKLFEEYLSESVAKGNPENWELPEGNPKNRALVANMSSIRNAVLDDLWQSEGAPSKRGKQWWELWLDPIDPDLHTLRAFAEGLKIKLLERALIFSDRTVVWIEAEWSDLEMLLFTQVPLAEIRRPSFIDTLLDLTVDEQGDYVEDLAGRIIPALDTAPAVCHLDSGVARTHVLLADSLAPTDLHSVFSSSGFDVQGHGTSMAGLALYGPLDDLFEGTGLVQLGHRLESVRILPSKQDTQTDPKDYGTVTIQAVATTEATIQRPRVFCMPVSTDPDKPGVPTLWSASVDAMAAGVDIIRNGEQLKLLSAPNHAAAKLIVLSAGNVDSYGQDHRAESDTSAIVDPAQAWNALTVGAHTELAVLPTDPQYSGWTALAERGTLSPHSRTSLLFGQKPWPIKPDICLEGGNVLTDGGQLFEDRHPLLSLTSTGSSHDLSVTSANATSAATAQAARLAALAMGEYPEYWPETIRGLLVHAADWTPEMRAEIDATSTKKQKLALLRRYGWGVPSEKDVLLSSRQAVTLVTQDDFVAFEGKDYKMRRFRLHSLPWPAEALSDIGASDVSLKITLSYFIEPNASRRGWRQKYSYASHGLRFELKNPLESRCAFIRRINRDAENDETSNVNSPSGSVQWLVGPDQRNLGSLHQDIWEGSAQELAACDEIAVYPVGGWWKRNIRKDRLDLPIRYSLIVSLKTPEQGTDLYTPIVTQLEVPIATEIFAT